MAEQPINQILVNPRAMYIGEEVIPLNQISRLKVIRYLDKRGFDPLCRTILNLGLALFLFGLLLIGLFGPIASGTATPCLFIGVVLVGVAALYSVSGPTRRILFIELSSGGLSVLSASTFDPLRQLQHDIANYIENPPVEPQTLHIGNVIHSIDLRSAQGIQIGNYNSQSILQRNQ